MKYIKIFNHPNIGGINICMEEEEESYDPPYRIIFSEYEDQKPRIHRLFTVYGCLQILLKKASFKQIIRIHDYKGDLIVIWKRKPTIKEKTAFEKAWELQEELKENVFHILECNTELK